MLELRRASIRTGPQVLQTLRNAIEIGWPVPQGLRANFASCETCPASPASFVRSWTGPIECRAAIGLLAGSRQGLQSGFAITGRASRRRHRYSLLNQGFHRRRRSGSRAGFNVRYCQ